MGVGAFQPSPQQLQQARAAYTQLPPVQQQQLAAAGTDQAAWEQHYLQRHFAPDAQHATAGGFDAGAELESLELEGTVPKAPFTYAPVALPNVDKARQWDGLDKNRLSGAQANEVIVKGYEQLDQQFQGYLGGNPSVANWMTYGKFAAREAGVQLTRVEAALRSLETLDPATLASSLGDVANSDGHFLKLLGDFGAPLWGKAMARAEQDAKGNPLLAVGGLASTIERALGYVKEDLKTLNHALVYGNTQIYDNIGPAFDSFMKAEAGGQDGVAAVKGLVQAGKIDDPQGFVVQAMTLYQQAHELQARIDAGEPGLEQTRQDMVARANLLLGVQEQQVILQSNEVFGSPAMHDIMAVLTPNATLTDPTGVHQLLSANQGNWADFKTRMGFDEFPSLEAARAALPPDQAQDPLHQPLVVTDHAGQVHYYLPSKDCGVNAGTITAYFNDNLKQPLLQHDNPRELPRLDQVNEFGGKVPLDITTDLRNARSDQDLLDLIAIAGANGHNDWGNQVQLLRGLPDGLVRARLVAALADEQDTAKDLEGALAAASTPDELKALASVAAYRHQDGIAEKARRKPAAAR